MGKTWFFSRFGGIGDSIILTVVAKAVLEKFPEDVIDFYVRDQQISLFKNLPIFRNVRELRRFPHSMQGNNCARAKDGWEFIETTKKKYDMVMDFVNSVENNSVNNRPDLIQKYGEWIASQNSNFANWIDLSLGWCKIDPTTVEDKSPMYIVEQREKDRACKLIEKYPRPHIGVNLFASSRARSFFNPELIVHDLTEEFSDGTIFLWNQEMWLACRKNNMVPIVTGQVNLRESAALIEQFDWLIAADSGMSHIAEAVKTDTVSIYTTVPAWTRSKYYKYSHDIDIQLDCKPCFTLQYQCPVNQQRAMDSLSAREKEVFAASSQNIPIQQASHLFNTTPDKLAQEAESVRQKLDAHSSVTPDCVSSISSDMIIDKIREAQIGETEMEETTETYLSVHQRT